MVSFKIQYANENSVHWSVFLGLKSRKIVQKRHKWDGVVSISDGTAAVMLLEFAGGFADVDQNKLEKDTIKLYRNATRLLNCKNSSPETPPSIFVVISHQFKIY